LERHQNSAEDVSNEWAVDAFITGLCHPEFIKEMGHIRLKKVSELVDIANKFTDGKDAYHNKRTWSPRGWSILSLQQSEAQAP
jgi:hypothetical protein